MGEPRGQHLYERLSEEKCLAALIFLYLHTVFLEEHNFRQENSKHLSNGAVTKQEQHSQYLKISRIKSYRKKNHFHCSMFSI